MGSSQNLDHLHVSTCVLYPLSLSWSQPRLSCMETCHLAKPSYSYCLCTRSQASTLPDPSALTCSGGLATESLVPGATGQATHGASTCSGTCLRVPTYLKVYFRFEHWFWLLTLGSILNTLRSYRSRFPSSDFTPSAAKTRPPGPLPWMVVEPS